MSENVSCPGAAPKLPFGKAGAWIALLCLMVPMFASYFFDDMFSTLSQIFQHPEALELG